MATVKIHEGTKIETSLDLQDDEGVIFVSPEKNKLWRFVPLGCFKGNKNRQVNLVITSKRVITVPTPPNKKNYEVESFYWKDIAKARIIEPSQESLRATWAYFAIDTKPGQTSSSQDRGQFNIRVTMTLGNLFKAFNSGSDNGTAARMMGTAAGWDSKYTASSLDRYYSAMSKRANERTKALNDKSDHQQVCSTIVALINDCVEEANAG